MRRGQELMFWLARWRHLSADQTSRVRYCTVL